MPSERFADIGIVGAGIAGLSMAYEAALRGHTVVVFEPELFEAF